MSTQQPTTITYTPIGVLHTPFKHPEEMPIQPSGKSSAPGTAEIFPPYQAALADLDGFSHVILIYHFHLVDGWKPRVTPFLDNVVHGLFATRAPARPNPIGLSVVRLDRVDDGVIHLGNLDVLDQTPLLDIKPYVPAFDQPSGLIEIGWLADAKGEVGDQRSDKRFTGSS